MIAEYGRFNERFLEVPNSPYAFLTMLDPSSLLKQVIFVIKLPTITPKTAWFMLFMKRKVTYRLLIVVALKFGSANVWP